MAKTEQEIKIRNDEVEWQPRPTLVERRLLEP